MRGNHLNEAGSQSSGSAALTDAKLSPLIPQSPPFLNHFRIVKPCAVKKTDALSDFRKSR
ncbi:hypothetical protein FHT70_003943 [Rhizobium sp. BK049]|nr:hypothetical protein [Rhizobium sp. BK049]